MEADPWQPTPLQEWIEVIVQQVRPIHRLAKGVREHQVERRVPCFTQCQPLLGLTRLMCPERSRCHRAEDNSALGLLCLGHVLDIANPLRNLAIAATSSRQ